MSEVNDSTGTIHQNTHHGTNEMNERNSSDHHHHAIQIDRNNEEMRSNEGGSSTANVVSDGDIAALPSDVVDGSPAAQVVAAEGEDDRRPSRPIRQNVLNRLHQLQHKHGQWNCFCCFHVTTGSLIIGYWDALLNCMTLFFLIISFIHPELLGNLSGENRGNGYKFGRPRPGSIYDREYIKYKNCSTFPCTLTNTIRNENGKLGVKAPMAPDFPLAVGHRFFIQQINTADGMNVAGFMTLCSLLVALLLLHGIRRKQPSHLMPFFFLQVLDFCISTMTMVSYVSYLPSLRQTLQASPSFPFKEYMLSMQTSCLTFFVIMIFVTAFMTKMYCINVVWRCYKYLLMNRITATGEDSSSSSRRAAAAQSNSGGTRSRLTASNAAPEHCMHWVMQQDNRGKLGGSFPDPPPTYDMAMASSYGVTGSQGSLSSDPPAYTASPPPAAAGGDDCPLLPGYEEAVQQHAQPAAAGGVSTSTLPQHV